MTPPRVFGVDYPFLSCGDVFTQGLAHAAHDLGIVYAHADWHANELPTHIRRFAPDLLLVVHGRRYVQRWRPEPAPWPTAVWLVDEPYEVDDTAEWSRYFSHVFVNDPATLARHAHASYLPVCYDPHVHHPGAGPTRHAVGFIGGANPTRERYLAALAAHDLLSYVIGGPWHDPRVQARCGARTIAPPDTATLYRTTRIVLNVFRERHHFNREAIPATSLNPRVYEGLACGALVVSEWRPELETLVPELPTFRTVEECVTRVGDLLAQPDLAEAIRLQCAARLAGHSYAARLRTVLAVVGSAVAA